MKKRIACTYAKSYKGIFAPECGCHECDRIWKRVQKRQTNILVRKMKKIIGG